MLTASCKAQELTIPYFKNQSLSVKIMNLKTTLIQICSICWIFRSKYLCGWRPNLHFNRHVHINSRQHRYLPPLAHWLVTDIEIHLRLLVKILPCCHVNF